jgi:hypothetical protein
MQWIREKPLYEEKISPEDLDLLTITDDVEEACRTIVESRRNREERERREHEERASREATRDAIQEGAGGAKNPPG